MTAIKLTSPRLTLPNLEAATTLFAQRRFIHLPRFLQADFTAGIYATTEGVFARRVRCRLPNVEWDEQEFETGHPARELFRDPAIVALMRRLTGLSHVKGVMCWTSCYSPGEYINPHCDRSGTVQLLVCLRAPSTPENGGTLHVAGTELFLAPGDAIAFEATSLAHYTTPAREHRVVLVGRYFMD